MEDRMLLESRETRGEVMALVVTIAEAARMLRISRAGAYRLAAMGELPTIRVGTRMRVPLWALDELVGVKGAPEDGS
jgi:excisionase family DNA binding protein